MKKLILFLSLSCIGISVSAQYINRGNALQQVTHGSYYNFRFNLGVGTPGFLNVYSKSQVDSVSSAGSLVNGFTVVSNPFVGQVLTTGSPENVLKQLFGRAQPPTAALTGGGVYELRTTPYVHNLSFNYGRLLSTGNIVSAVITPGPLNVFSTNPAAPGSVSGTQSVSTPTNATVAYTLTVTDANGNVTTAVTTDTGTPARYWGRSATNDPGSATIIAVAGGAKQIINSKANSGFTVTSSGSNYVYYAYPAALGDLTFISIGGFSSFDVFTKRVVSVTNVNGHVEDYNVYTSNDTYSATTPIIITL